MNKTQIQSLIEVLRMQTAANSITPNMLANILTELNNNSASDTDSEGATIEATDAPLLYCEVRSGLLYLRNFKYYKALGLEPILFRYIKKKNRWNITGSKLYYGPKKKGWFANGKQGTIMIESTGLVKRNALVLNRIGITGNDYRSSAGTFPCANADAPTSRGVTWGCSEIDNHPGTNYRMVRLPFAVGFAPKVTSEKAAITVADLVSNLAPFFIRGQKNREGDYEWAFTR